MKDWSRKIMMICLVAATAFLSGCGSLMTEAKSPIAESKADTARVFFALDQGFPQGGGVITEGTKLLGAIYNGQHFYADVPAGEHLFILKSEQDEAIKANLEAGKTYYVKVFITPGVMSTRTYWTPLKNTAEDLKIRDEMIKDTKRVELVPEKAAKWEADEKEELIEREQSFKSGEDEIKQTIGSENAM